MANTYKNIVITPNRDTGANVVPSIRFSGGDGTSNTDINVRAYTTQSGTLSFEGTAGQLFSITNDLTNVIFSVNDVSGIPSLEIDANGKITFAEFGGNVGIGTANPTSRLQVNGTFFVTQNNTSQLDVIGEIAEFAHNSNTYAQIHVRNANTGTRSSSDIVATADIGTDSSEFIDLGINSSTYNDPAFTIGVAKDGYLYTSNSNLTIGTANTNKSLVFFTGGTLSTNKRAEIDSIGYMSGTVNGLSTGRIPAMQYYRLNSDLARANVTTAQSTFGVGVTLVGSTVYEFETDFILAKTTGSASHTINLSFGGTATINNILYGGITSAVAAATPAGYSASAGSFDINTAAATQATITVGIANINYNHRWHLRGTVSINAGGTFIPQFTMQFLAGTYNTLAGSWFRIFPLAAAGTVNIGSWA